MGAVSIGQSRGFQIGHELALIPLQSEPRSRQDQATIAPRSGIDRDFGAPEITFRISGKDHS